jgi:DNA-binding protein H-NS
MKTYHAVRAEIAKLEAKAESLRKNELKSVIAQVRKTIAEYGLTAADLGLGRAAAKSAGRKATTVGVAKYRDPQSGQTWTGRGRPPTWILAAKDRSAFLIDGAASPAAAKKGSAPRKARAKAAPARKRGKGRPARQSGSVQIESGAAAQ